MATLPLDRTPKAPPPRRAHRGTAALGWLMLASLLVPIGVAIGRAFGSALLGIVGAGLVALLAVALASAGRSPAPR